MSDRKRKLNPHKPARAAMWLYNVQYASQSGGCMDFWDRLPESEKRLCRVMVKNILDSRDEDRDGLDGN